MGIVDDGLPFCGFFAILIRTLYFSPLTSIPEDFFGSTFRFRQDTLPLLLDLFIGLDFPGGGIFLGLFPGQQEDLFGLTLGLGDELFRAPDGRFSGFIDQLFTVLLRFERGFPEDLPRLFAGGIQDLVGLFFRLRGDDPGKLFRLFPRRLAPPCLQGLMPLLCLLQYLLRGGFCFPKEPAMFFLGLFFRFADFDARKPLGLFPGGVQNIRGFGPGLRSNAPGSLPRLPLRFLLLRCQPTGRFHFGLPDDFLRLEPGLMQQRILPVVAPGVAAGPRAFIGGQGNFNAELGHLPVQGLVCLRKMDVLHGDLLQLQRNILEKEAHLFRVVSRKALMKLAISDFFRAQAHFSTPRHGLL